MNDDFECHRGLEKWTSPLLYISRCFTIVRARTEVQLEQSHQILAGTTDPQRIAELYQTASAQAGSFAQILAIADAELVATDNGIM